MQVILASYLILFRGSLLSNVGGKFRLVTVIPVIQTNIQEVAALHESHLRKMRIVERPVNLKPFESVINPMLVRRNQWDRSTHFSAIYVCI